MSLELAVDGGQTNLRMALVHDGVAVEITHAGGFAYSAETDLLDSVANAVTEAYEALGSPAAVRRICLGLTAAPLQPDRRRRLAARIRDRLGDPEVWLGPDMVTAHAGALGGAPGVVTTAGTGVVCLGISADGGAHQGDGHGYLLGDAGSGFSIGRAALRAVLAARDGRGPATTLTEAAREALGDLAGLSQRIYTSPAPVRMVARCTPWVAAAAREGDAVAQAIWADAVDALVVTTAAVLARSFPSPEGVPVSWAGGLFAMEDLVRRPFTDAIQARCPGVEVREPLGNPLDGAVRLLAGLGPYEPLMLTAGRDAHV
ncbi:N-acetylglucosamine kinase [Jiangella anatolica]|uniref:ATPase n=1 Tax=Jiangella anatolica TaxID=2670374 RepID=A0A2W2B8R2_9ACTN|nr:BadF/BadG/BcrA/BcrD ATPase family protein [Jiangella anatolica]PZF83635.1 ATPase [Jiangella anatolica]